MSTNNIETETETEATSLVDMDAAMAERDDYLLESWGFERNHDYDRDHTHHDDWFEAELEDWLDCKGEYFVSNRDRIR